MKRNGLPVFTFATALAVVLAFPLAMRKPRTSTKPSAPCAMAQMERKQLATISRPPTCKRNRMPISRQSSRRQGSQDAQVRDKLKPEEIKGLVAYIRTLK